MEYTQEFWCEWELYQDYLDECEYEGIWPMSFDSWLNFIESFYF